MADWLPVPTVVAFVGLTGLLAVGPLVRRWPGLPAALPTGLPAGAAPETAGAGRAAVPAVGAVRVAHRG